MTFFDSTGDGSCTAPGTGAVTLSGTAASGGYVTAVGNVPDATAGAIRIVDSTNADTFEVCESVYTSAGTSASRGTLLKSSTGSRVNFTNAVNVYWVAPAEVLNNPPSWTTGYTPALTTLVNTASPVDVVTVTIPANTWDDGESVTIEHVANIARGTVVSFSVLLGVNADSYDPTNGQPFNATLTFPVRSTFRRVGSDVWIMDDNGEVIFNTVASAPSMFAGFFSASTAQTSFPTGPQEYISASVDFTADVVLKVIITCSGASPSNSYTPSSACAFKYNTSLK